MNFTHLRIVMHFLVLETILSCCSWAASDQPPQPPCSQDPGLQSAALDATVCKTLDDVFRDFAGSCSLTFPINLTKNSDLTKPPERAAKYQVSAVPILLLNAVKRTNMATPMRISQNLGVSRLLSQVLTSKSLQNLRPSDYIGATATQQPATLTQLGIDATLYSTSCQATLAADATAKIGFSFAPVTLSTSLSGSLNSKSNSGLSVTVGTFDSPLWVFSTSGQDSLYSYLLMLAWRVNNHKTADQLYYLAHAHGLTSSQLTSAQMNSNAQLNASLTAGFLVVSTKDNLDIARQVTDTLSASFYDTVIDTPADTDFVPVPSVSDLQANILGIQLSSPHVSTNLMQHPGDRAHISQEIAGVPQDMCSGQGTSWSIADADSTQTNWTLDAGSFQRSIKAGTALPVCVFEFDILNKSNADFVASPRISGTYQGTSFVIKMPTLSFQADPYPQFLSSPLYKQDGTFTTENGVSVLQYAVVIAVAQAQAGGGYNSMSWQADAITAKCPNNTSIRLWPSTPASLSVSAAGNSQATASLDYNLSDAKGDLDKNDSNPIQCTLASGKLLFSDTSGALQPIPRAITSDLGLGVKVPRVKPALVARQVGINGSTYTFAGTISSVSDASILANTSATLYDGTVALKTGRIKPDFTIDFDPVNLDQSVKHTITIGLSPSGTISGATSQQIVVQPGNTT